MKENGQKQTVESAQAPMELVAQGATIVRLENAEQMAIAVQRPRDEALILHDCLHELDLYPTMAREAIYNKPVGKDDKGEMKYAEGLSIRAAESLGNRWNNSSYGVEIVSEDEETATIAAVFLDYEKNTRHVAMQRVSKFYKTKGGQIVRHAPDRFDLVLKANSSKNLREIVLRSLPAGLKKEYETKARNILKKEPLAQQRTAILERFAELGVSVQQLETWKSRPIKEWKKEDIIEALGVVNALRDGELSIEGVFGKPTEAKKEFIPGLQVKEETKQEEGKLPPPSNPVPGVPNPPPGERKTAESLSPMKEIPQSKEISPMERLESLKNSYPTLYEEACKLEGIYMVMNESAAIILEKRVKELHAKQNRKKS